MTNVIGLWYNVFISYVWVNSFSERFSEFYMSPLNLIKLHDQIKTPEMQVDFLQKHGILHKSSKCDKCDLVTDKVHRRAGSKYHFFRCPKCLQQSSIRKNTILYNKSISLRSFLMLAYFFISLNLTHDQLIHETNLSDDDDDPDAAGPAGPGPSLSCCTTVDYTTLFRCGCHVHLITHGHVVVSY